MSEAADDRPVRAQQALAALGLGGIAVRTAGHAGEVAILSCPVRDWERLVGGGAGSVVERVKELGYRYVALDLDPSAPGE